MLVPPSYVIDEKKGIDGAYTWEDECDIADLPAWIGERLQKPETEISAAKRSPVDRSHLEDLLRHCGSASTSRNDWRDIVAAIRNTNIENDDDEAKRLDIALAWSRGDYAPDGVTPGNYDGDDAVVECFESMPPKADGVGYGTILHAARQGGYTGPSAVPVQTAAEVFAGAAIDRSNAPEEREPGIIVLRSEAVQNARKAAMLAH